MVKIEAWHHCLRIILFFHRNGHTGKWRLNLAFEQMAVTRWWRWARAKVSAQKRHCSCWLVQVV